MNTFGTFFLRDVKKIGAVYGGVMVAFLMVNVSILFLFHLSANARLGFSDLCLLLLFAAHPILLSLSFTDESLVKSDQQWFALPIRRSSVVLSRFLTVLIFLVISTIVGFLWSLLMVPVYIEQNERYLKGILLEEMCRRGGSTDFARIIPYYHDFWGFLFHMSRYFFFAKLLALCSFVLMGLVILTQSFRYTIKRYNGFLRNLTILALFILFCLLGFRGMNFAKSVLDTGSIVNSLVAGVMFLAIGIFIWSRPLREVRRGVIMRTIRPYLALMKKDFGSIAEVAIFLVILNAAAEIFHMIFNIAGEIFSLIRYSEEFILGINSTPVVAVGLFFQGIVFMITAVFVYSVNTELSRGTKYLHPSLPVSPSWFLLGKFWVIIGVGACIYFIECAIAHLPWSFVRQAILIHFTHYYDPILKHWPDSYFRLHTFHPVDFISPIIDPKFWYSIWYSILFRLKELIFYLGLACFSQGVISLVNRSRLIIWTSIFITGVIAYANYKSILFTMFFDNQSSELYRVLDTYSAPAAGLIFLVIGLIFFEKYVEV